MCSIMAASSSTASGLVPRDSTWVVINIVNLSNCCPSSEPSACRANNRLIARTIGLITPALGGKNLPQRSKFIRSNGAVEQKRSCRSLTFREVTYWSAVAYMCVVDAFPDRLVIVFEQNHLLKIPQESLFMRPNQLRYKREFLGYFLAKVSV